jgi:hypothetical protein
MELVTIVTICRFNTFTSVALSGCYSSIEQFNRFVDQRIVLK